MNVKPETYIHHLPPKVRRTLKTTLDPHDHWKILAEQINNEDGTPMFEQQQIDYLDYQKPHRSPTESLLSYWGTKNACVDALLQALQQAELYRSADYLAVDVLGGEPVDRLEEKEVSSHIQNAPTTLIGDPPGKITVHPEPGENWEPINLVITSDTEDPQLFSSDDLASITENFNDQRLLGSGGFGHVYLGKATDENNEEFSVAVKKMSYTEGSALEKGDHLMTAIKVLSRFQHENLLPLLGYAEEADNICLVYKYMENGSLMDRLACKDDTPPLNIATRISIAIGTARGINFLHTHEEKPMIHRDIKSANVLLDSSFSPKISDFDLCRRGPTGINTTAVCTQMVIGTPVYMAAEGFKGDISSKLDTYAFGVVLLELLTGWPPFRVNDGDTYLGLPGDGSTIPSDIVSRVEEALDDEIKCQDETAGKWPEELVDEIQSLAWDKCLQNKKKRRPTMTEVLTAVEDLQKFLGQSR